MTKNCCNLLSLVALVTSAAAASYVMLQVAVLCFWRPRHSRNLSTTCGRLKSNEWCRLTWRTWLTAPSSSATLASLYVDLLLLLDRETVTVTVPLIGTDGVIWYLLMKLFFLGRLLQVDLNVRPSVCLSTIM